MLTGLYQELEQTACRGVLMISGDRDWTYGAATELLDTLSGDSVLIGTYPVGGLVPTAKAALLGQECDLLLWDLFCRPDANTLAASSGCLSRGGLLILLAPEPVRWSEYFTCDDGSPSYYWQHMLRSLGEHPLCAHLSETQGWEDPQEEFPYLDADNSLPTADQLQVMTLVRRVLHGHRRRPLVIRADRGRGKSALLGLSAAEFLQEEAGNILVTAPRRQAVDALFRHAADRLGAEDVAGKTLSMGDSSLLFYPPDQLLAQLPPGRLLLVDEAAAISPAILASLVQRYPRVVFATTVHGYEGSGRGFDIRFTETLDCLTPQWQAVELQEPIRWSEGDPLEAILNRCFLLDADIAPPKSDIADQLRVDWVDKETLLADENLLRQVFGLLVAAHYQTAPSDLQQLMDSLATHVFVIRNDQSDVLAAALVIEEGGLPESWLDPVQQGQRRLQGHLLPQSLTYHLGVDEGLSLRCARVSRIAVHASYRRRGLGRTLLAEIESFALAQGIDYVGSSFAADSQVLPFWLGADYLPLRLGIRRDPCSGSHALLIARPLSEAAAQVLPAVYERFCRDFPLQLREMFGELDVDVVRMLLTSREPGTRPDPQVRREAQRFAAGEIAYEHAYAALFTYLVSVQAPLPASDEVAIAIRKVLQGAGWKMVAQQFQLTGRKAVEHCLRQAYRLLLSLEG